jgi:hypothetical protein
MRQQPWYQAGSRSAIRAAVVCALLLAVDACGSRTGVRAPADASDRGPPDTYVPPDLGPPPDTGNPFDVHDARDAVDLVDVVEIPDTVDVYDAPDLCLPQHQRLQTQESETLLVLDHSGSLGRALEPGVTRERGLTEALRLVLPRYETSLRMGALVFPRQGSQCAAPAELDVAPALRTAEMILTRYEASFPNGGTPTSDALLAALRYYRSTPSHRTARSIVLATDGEPTCNLALDPRTCICTVAGTPCATDSCLDDARTVGTIAEALREGIPTFVIGIDSATAPALQAVLERMAVAGGRPRSGTPRYSSVRSAAAMEQAFEAIQHSIAGCVFTATVRLHASAVVRVLLDGVALGRDATHVDGWDWTATEQVSLFGAACERVRPDSVVEMDLTCP